MLGWNVGLDLLKLCDVGLDLLKLYDVGLGLMKLHDVGLDLMKLYDMMCTLWLAGMAHWLGSASCWAPRHRRRRATPLSPRAGSWPGGSPEASRCH